MIIIANSISVIYYLDADIRNLTPTNDTVTSPVPMSSGDNATSVIIDSGTHNTFIIVGVSIGLVLIMITAAITAALIIVRVAITLRKKSRGNYYFLSNNHV